MNTMTRASIVAAMSLTVLGTQVRAETALRLAHWLPPGHSLQTTGFEPWAQSMAEASGGGIGVTIFPAQQLGSATDHYDIARDGIADLAFVAPSYQPGRFPVISLAEHPFMVTNAVEGSAAFNDWYMQYAAQEMPDVHVCMAFMQDPGTLHTVAPMTMPGDLRGVNLRPANAVMGSMIALLGGASVQVPAPEAREVIARGAAEGITFPWDSVFLFGIDKETRHHIDFPLYTTVFVMAMNRASYDAMPEADRAVVDAHCTSEWAQKIATGWAQQEQSGRVRAIDDPAHTVHVPTPEELAAWREATAPLMTAWSEEVAAKGQDAAAIEASFRDIMGRAGALFE